MKKKKSVEISLSKGIKLQFDRPLSKAQAYILQGLDASDIIDYLKSMQGAMGRGRDARLWQVRNKRIGLKNKTVDRLAQKGEGTILKLFQQKIDPTTNKRPDNVRLGDWIGVEIECFVPRGQIEIEDCDDCSCEFNQDGEVSYTCSHCDGDCDCSAQRARNSHEDTFSKVKRDLMDMKVRNITVKGDSSIDPQDNNYVGIEITVLFLRDNPANLKQVCEYLNKIGAKVNKSCGLHVHLDCRDLKVNGEWYSRGITTRAKRLGNALPVMLQMVPKSRRNNTRYCAPRVGSRRDSRYVAINTTAIDRFGTIEIRLHSGTTSFTKIMNWVETMYRVSRSSRMSKAEVTSPAELYAKAGLTDDLLTYIVGRISHFSGNSSGEEMRDADDTDQPAPVVAETPAQVEMTLNQEPSITIRNPFVDATSLGSIASEAYGPYGRAVVSESLTIDSIARGAEAIRRQGMVQVERDTIQAMAQNTYDRWLDLYLTNYSMALPQTTVITATESGPAAGVDDDGDGEGAA
jgi:hypothetical protein